MEVYTLNFCSARRDLSIGVKKKTRCIKHHVKFSPFKRNFLHLKKLDLLHECALYFDCFPSKAFDW